TSATVGIAPTATTHTATASAVSGSVVCQANTYRPGCIGVYVTRYSPVVTGSPTVIGSLVPSGKVAVSVTLAALVGTPSTTTRCSSVSDCPAYTLTATLSPDLYPITTIAVRHPPAWTAGKVSGALAALGGRALLARLLLALVLLHEGNHVAALHVGQVGLRHVEHMRRVGAPLIHAGASTAKRWPLHLRLLRLGGRVGDLPNAIRPGGGDS